MSIRTYQYPRELDISPILRDTLRKNGMQAHLSVKNDGRFELIVLGHDSPALRYDLSNEQVENLMKRGSSYTDKVAYTTFTQIVKDDFEMPDNYVSAINADGRVVMGLHGYRIGAGEYGYHGIPFFRPYNRFLRGWGGDFLGWSPRQQPGFHLRRIGGGLFVPERPDRSLRPGEMRSGGYGFYYKGQRTETAQDVLDSLTIEEKLQPLKGQPRPEGKAIPYGFSSDVYFCLHNETNTGWYDILKSHGIVIDEKQGTMTIQSSSTKVGLMYDLTPEEMKIIMSPYADKNHNGVSVNDRLAVINNRIAEDFDDRITFKMLESKNLVDISLRPEVREEVEAKFIQREKEIQEQEKRLAEKQQFSDAVNNERKRLNDESIRIAADPNAINGKEIREILGNYGFFTAEKHGRDVVVGEIRVDETAGQHYLMTAEINGVNVSHTISKKEYDKFLQLDDEHRLRLFDEKFKEIKIRNSNSGRDLYSSPVFYAKNENGDFITREETDIAHSRANFVDGSELTQIKESKGFYREIENGREVNVGEIRVDKINDDKYRMTAVIDDIEVSHDISEKQYQKFLAVDDYQRMKLFSKIFPEVDMKTRPGMGTNVGAALLAALVVGTEVVHDVVGMARGLHGPHPHDPLLDKMAHDSPVIYAKPGVVSPGEIVQHNYNAQLSSMLDEDIQMHRGL